MWGIGCLPITLSTATVDVYLSRWQLGVPRGGQPSMTSTRPLSLTSSERLHALVAVADRGLLFFLVSEQPFDEGQAAEFRKRLRMQIGCDLRVAGFS